MSDSSSYEEEEETTFTNENLEDGPPVSGSPSAPGGGQGGWLRALEQSKQWELLIIGAILANTCLLAVEADMMGPEPVWAKVLDDAFLCIFCCELTLRLCIYHQNFFVNKDWPWNVFDFSVVTMGVIDQWILGPLGGTGHYSAVASFFRTLRILRILRAVRLFKQFKELNRLANGLVNSVSAVAWVAVMFFMLVASSSIFVTSMVGKEADLFEDPEKIHQWFGTMPNSMTTLSIFLTCDDWSTPARMVNKVFPSMVYFWILYQILGTFLILSLLTGLMADKMNEARDEQEGEDAPKADELPDLLRQLKEGPLGHGGTLNAAQFDKVIMKKAWKESLEKVGLRTAEPGDRQWLFDALDHDASGFISWEELDLAFAQIGRHAEQPGGAPLEIMKLEGTITQLDRKLSHAHQGKKDGAVSWDQKVDIVHARVGLLRERLLALEADVNQFFNMR